MLPAVRSAAQQTEQEQRLASRELVLISGAGSYARCVVLTWTGHPAAVCQYTNMVQSESS